MVLDFYPQDIIPTTNETLLSDEVMLAVDFFKEHDKLK